MILVFSTIFFSPLAGVPDPPDDLRRARGGGILLEPAGTAYSPRMFGVLVPVVRGQARHSARLRH